MSSGILNIDGLVSGLNTTDIINQLLEVERIPITRLEARKSEYEQKIALWQEANTKLLALQTAASSLASESTFQEKAVSVSNESILTATATSSAVTGTYLLRVEQLAYAHQIATSSSYADYDTTTFGEGIITIQVGTGTPVEINIDSSNNTLEGIKNAINSSGAGATASIVNTTDGYKLLLSSNQTGLEGALTVTSDLSGGEATLSDFYDIQPAQNARINLGTSEGGATPLVYESSSNLVEDLIPGVSLNLKAASTESVVLTVEDDLESIKGSIRNLVARFNEFQDFVSRNTSFDADTGVAGALLGDTSLQRIQYQILNSLFQRVTNSYFENVAEIGISVDRYGRLSLDESKLEEALQNNLEEVEKLFVDQGVGVSLKESLDFIVDPYQGIVKNNQDLYQGLIEDINERIEILEERLSRKEEFWREQFVALEEALAAFQTQGVWLTQQLASLSALAQSSSNQRS